MEIALELIKFEHEGFIKKYKQILSKSILILNDLGESLRREEEFEKALVCFNVGIRFSVSLENRKSFAQFHSNLGLVKYEMSKFQEAEEILSKALEVHYEIDNKEGISYTLNSLGLLKKDTGFVKEALEYFTQALQICDELKLSDLESTLYINIGSIYEFLGKYNKAFDNFDKGLQCARLNSMESEEAYALNSIGIVFLNWKQYEHALEYFLRSLEIHKKMSYSRGEAIVYSNLGQLYSEIKDFNKSERYFRLSYETSIKTRYRHVLQVTFSNWGLSKYSRGEFEEAISLYHKALEISTEIKDELGHHITKYNVALALAKLEKVEEALELCIEVLEYTEKSENKVLQELILQTLGRLFFEQERYIETVEYLEKSLKISEKLVSENLNSEIRIASRLNQNYTINTLVESHIELRDYERALLFVEYNKGKEMFKESNKKRKTPDSNFETDNSELINLTNELNEIENMLTILERRLEAISLDMRNDEANSDIYLKEKQETQIEVDALLDQRRKVKQIIWTEFPDTKSAELNTYHEVLEYFKKLEKKDWIVLDFYDDFEKKCFYIFKLEENKDIIVYKQEYQIENYQELIVLIKEFLETRRQQHFTTAEEQIQNIGNRIFELLIPKDLELYMENHDFSFLTVIPSSKINLLPLEITNHKGSYWGIKYIFSRAFNLKTLKSSLENRKIKKKNKALVFGDPTFDIEHLKLPASKEEVLETSKILKDSGYEVNTATEEQTELFNFLKYLNSQKYSIIHFSGHAIFEKENPNLSYLFFQENKQLKRLYANLIPLLINIENNPLLILSACETGLVEINYGDEIFGIPRGFIQAGVTDIVTTGWNITDEVSKDFFKKFYRYYTCSKGIAESMQLARKYFQDKGFRFKELELKNTELIHWGAFQFYGCPF